MTLLKTGKYKNEPNVTPYMSWDQAWLAFSVFFDTFQWLAFAVGILTALAFLPRRHVFIQSLLLTGVAAFALKLFFQQDRPCVLQQALVACPPDFGMPSIHAALAGVFFMAGLGTRWAALLIFPIALLIAYSRIFLGVHSIEQVVAGFSLAVVAYLANWLYIERKGDPK